MNTFNQPGVDSYKNNMFALLGKPGYDCLLYTSNPQIEKHVKEKRAAALAVTAEKIRSAFLRSQIGKTVLVKITDSDKDYCYAKSV